ncbi:hypothetical protein P152DRAFT_485973 [Eremomyces bilateralis CBS 781.70]|uniref:Inclusion body clearance protein IML2 n=1 Tax=Eremomyces bilateralis CBS 781.70 TaxID=1392243 RepID=A0A6G1GFC6_9PEZI|nr:uncharacterized protein P152DRAFT_485973 [Eremomyces bilateralis CBS 781.70]KAF1816787.1 hypothetical protein P152DRAFT_485973 [Eremomyces bilateralis CBS 781.70]
MLICVLGVLKIMDDDVEGAEEALSKHKSPYHSLGLGTTVFLRATLGFEKEYMKLAADRLAEAATSAGEFQRKAQRDLNPNPSNIYPPGSEFGYAMALSEIMAAVIATLNESLTEAIRGFYKMRKAYMTLNTIVEAERVYFEKHGYNVINETPSLRALSRSATIEHEPEPDQSIPVSKASSPIDSSDQTEEDEFFDAEEATREAAVPTKEVEKLKISENGSAAKPPATNPVRTVSFTNGSIKEPNGSTTGPVRSQSVVSNPYQEGPDPEAITGNPTDVFVHSGINLAFGLLLLLISLVPPAFSMLLKIAGIKGDRERAISMLWQASKFDNINGAFAGLVLLGYYNVMVGFCDILPRVGSGSHPKERCRNLLQDCRKRYPKSQLWVLEEARMMSAEKNLEEAVQFLRDSPKSPLKQVEAFQWFEISLNCMYGHDYEGTSEGFQKCVLLNNWSPSLYYYIAACAHIELYRIHKEKDADLSTTHATQAESLLSKIPKNASARKLLSRPLPFDIFVARKLTKWQSRATALSVPLVAAAGVSPFEEMIYFWNGYRRMRPEHLATSLERLAWSEAGAGAVPWDEEEVDEKGVMAVLKSATLRSLGRTEEAEVGLRENVLGEPWSAFKGGNKDNWSLPLAHYEMAIIRWEEWGDMEVEGEAARRGKLAECKEWLEKVANWEAYDLDARMGLRITTARDTIKKAEVKLVA